MRLPDGAELTQAPEEGRLLDCMRRYLGLPTPPPAVSPSTLQSALWLAAIIDEGSRAYRVLTWRDALRLHPVCSSILSECAGIITERQLGDVVRAAAGVWTWGRLRQDTLQNHWASGVVPDHLARWMDDGMFSRWILAELPDPEDLIKQIRGLVAPATARRIAHAVRAAA
jgi:hypothetical protein